MAEKVTPLTVEDKVFLDSMRSGLRGMINPEARDGYDEIGGKLAVIDAVLRHGAFDRTNVWLLQALGLTFGDALAQQLELRWAIVTDDLGRTPALVKPGTTLKVYALTIIQKRVEVNEEFDAPSLFEAFCHHVESTGAAKPSLFGRLFGPRIK